MQPLDFWVAAKELRSKGYDSFIILKWLASELADCQLPAFEHISAVIWGADKFASLLCSSPWFMTEATAQQIRVVGEAFCKLYLQGVHERPLVFKVRPKWHLVLHVCNDAHQRRSHRNPNTDSTWLEEDFMKKVSRVIKRTHKRTSACTALQRYAIAVRQKLATLRR